MAFISELNFRGSAAATEWVEITLGPNDDPDDFVVSVYRHNGNLHSNAGIPGGEVRLSSLSPVPHPDNPNFTIYIVSVGIKSGTSDGNEGSAIALTNTAEGQVVDFYGAKNQGAIVAKQGAADGASSDPVLDFRNLNIGQSYQWDVYGNEYYGTISLGSSILCLTSEVPVRTPLGYRPCHKLRPGDLVWTLDHGYQPVRWIGQAKMPAALFAAEPKTRPILLRRDALAPGVPLADLYLSRQHRVLLRSKVADHMVGEDEVLIPAIQFATSEIAEIDNNPPDLIYMHLLFDRHEVIDASGALVESLMLGPQSSEALTLGQFRDAAGHRLPRALYGCAKTPARPLLTGKQARALIDRTLARGAHLQPPCDDQPATALAAFF